MTRARLTAWALLRQAVALKSLTIQVKNQFPIDVAISGPDDLNNASGNAIRQAVITTHFNSIVTENMMKMKYLNPTETTFDFANADTLYICPSWTFI
jgi:endo-1,4-beta-xylanase